MQHIKQMGLLVLACAVLASVFYVTPITLALFPNMSYRFVAFFIILIFTSNVLAKVARAYANA